MFSSTYDTITTTTLIIRLLFAIGGMFLWGYVCKHIVRSKGYPDSENKGFWWGFFLGWIGIIVCVTKKPYNNPMNQFGQFDQFNQYGQGGFNNYGQPGGFNQQQNNMYGGYQQPQQPTYQPPQPQPDKQYDSGAEMDGIDTSNLTNLDDMFK